MLRLNRSSNSTSTPSVFLGSFQVQSKNYNLSQLKRKWPIHSSNSWAVRGRVFCCPVSSMPVCEAMRDDGTEYSDRIAREECPLCNCPHLVQSIWASIGVESHCDFSVLSVSQPDILELPTTLIAEGVFGATRFVILSSTSRASDGASLFLAFTPSLQPRPLCLFIRT